MIGQKIELKELIHKNLMMIKKYSEHPGMRLGNGYLSSFDLTKIEIIKTNIKYTSYILRCKRCCHVFQLDDPWANKCPMCKNNFAPYRSVDTNWIGTESHKKWVESHKK